MNNTIILLLGGGIFLHSQKNSEHIKIYILGFIILLIIVNLTGDTNEHLTDTEALLNVASLYNNQNMKVTNLEVTGKLTVGGDLTVAGPITSTNDNINAPKGSLTAINTYLKGDIVVDGATKTGSLITPIIAPEAVGKGTGILSIWGAQINAPYTSCTTFSTGSANISGNLKAGSINTTRIDADGGRISALDFYFRNSDNTAWISRNKDNFQGDTAGGAIWFKPNSRS